jgi:accessory gene regulator protein AgrB
MGAEIGIFWIFLAFVVVGIIYIFWFAGDKLTPKNSPISGKPISEEKRNKTSAIIGITLFILVLFVLTLI